MLRHDDLCDGQSHRQQGRQQHHRFEAANPLAGLRTDVLNGGHEVGADGRVCVDHRILDKHMSGDRRQDAEYTVRRQDRAHLGHELQARGPQQLALLRQALGLHLRRNLRSEELLDDAGVEAVALRGRPRHGDDEVRASVLAEHRLLLVGRLGLLEQLPGVAHENLAHRGVVMPPQGAHQVHRRTPACFLVAALNILGDILQRVLPEHLHIGRS
mmetsp:Transcript_69523/g.201418  ORF Transcript_69523/g.201418 Transcript_69523/m.201418 type:complete len:214 (+) Transcript_69523:1237-1878(+)